MYCAWRKDGTATRDGLRDSYCRTAPLDHLFVDADELSGDMRPVKFGGAARAGLAQSYAQSGLADEPFERGRDPVGIFRLDQEPRNISLYDTLVAMDIARHDRKACGHGLEQHDAERLLAGGRRAEDVRGLVKACLVDVVDAAREQHVL